MRRLAIAVFGALAFSAAPAHAATFQVNTPDDISAGCNAVVCSLRGALSSATANGSLEDDVINVPPGVYAAAAEFSLSGVAASRITINGAGSGSTFIEPTGQSRVFSLGAQAGLTLRALTVRGGLSLASSPGGNIQVISARLTLESVRVTNGQASAGGGGIGAQSLSGVAVLDIRRSLIDANAALGSGTGGGIALLAGTSGGVTTTITDSTIAYNNSQTAGAGIAGSQAPTLRGVTIAFNNAVAGTGGIQAGSGAATIQGSIIAGNRGANNAFDNCALPVSVTDAGGNVDSINDCGFTNPASRVNTNPQLATTFDASQPPALSVPEASPAVDLAECGTSTLDQRGVQRPQGVRCDAGAYEFNTAPDTAVGGAGPPFTFSSNEAGTTFECSVDGAPFTPCAAPFDPAAAPGTHTLAVRAVDPQGLPDPTPATVTFTVQPPPATPTPTPSPTPTATPVVNRTIVVGPARGTVKVKVPGSKRYVELDSTIGIPVGSSVDTRKGRVTLTSIPKAGAAPQTAVFFDGLFKVTQSRGITNLTLTEQLAACPKKKSSRASAAAKKKSRKLWGDGKGAFRTSGKYSAATVRGTRWLVEDTCAGTRTRVTQGTVTVRHRNRTIIVRPGKPYLAKPR